MRITSAQNAKVKESCKLASSKERKLKECFLVEGTREITRCIQSGYKITSFFYCPKLWNKFLNKDNSLSNEELINAFNANNSPIYELTSNVFNKLSSRENPDGNIAVASSKKHTDFRIINTNKKNLSLLVLESIEKPGNLGAIIRTAEGAGVDGIILCDPIIDIYNPHVIRNSQGAVFSIPIVISNTNSTQQFLRENNISPILTTPSAQNIYWNIAIPTKSAFIMGSEKDGLSDSWLKTNFTSVKIPMMGNSDSLNVSTATALILYETLKQKENVKS